jgi:hypothetical protein
VIELQRLRHQLATVIVQLERLTPAQRANGHKVEAIALEARLAELQRSVSAAAGTLAELAVEVKDLEHGIVDFPARRNGDIVYLCWRVGEPEIGYWHPIDAGFAGRSPVDERTE